MCLQPVDILNPHKYISLRYRDRYILQVPCGKCAECQSSLSNQWQYRTYYEFSDCLACGGFVLFDTLTYSDEHLPTISKLLPTSLDFACFSSRDLQLFLKRLRRKNVYRSSVRYFICSEYGELHHRPHYHVLFFVKSSSIDPIVFSRDVAKSWSKGRTDGIPFKSANYVLSHNVIRNNAMSNILRTVNYVTKYVQKSSLFQRELDKRISLIMSDVENKMSVYVDDWSNSLIGKQFRTKIKRLVNQFHLQSLHYGESALSDLDIGDYFKNDCLFMPHYKAIKIPVVMPTYYKRKLFYRLVEIDGAKSWQLNELGREYNKHRNNRLVNHLADRFRAVVEPHSLSIDCVALADYVVNYRGRIKADFDSVDIVEKLKHVDLFNYVSRFDVDRLGKRGLSVQFLGNSTIGYKNRKLPFVKVGSFVAKYVFLDDIKEKQLMTIYSYLSAIDKGKQCAFDLRQHLTQVYKCFIPD